MKNGKLTENGIRRVVWIPEKLDQEIENLRRNIGYTRSGFYRYALTRLMEQLLLTKQKKAHLQHWQEITGMLKKVEVNDEITTAIITCTNQTDFVISYPNNTKEAETLQTLKKLIGQKVEILRTDISDKPLIVKTINKIMEVDNENTKTINPIVITDKSSEILQNPAQRKETPKNKQEGQVPTTNLDLSAVEVNMRDFYWASRFC